MIDFTHIQVVDEFWYDSRLLLAIEELLSTFDSAFLCLSHARVLALFKKGIHVLGIPARSGKGTLIFCYEWLTI